ncbi:MAG: PAS domain S-box protein, partial [Chitinophagaceae bacterium]
TEQKFDAVFEHSSKAKLLLDIEEQIINANQAFLTLCGYSKEETEGKNLSDIKRMSQLPIPEVDLQWKENCLLIHKNGSQIEAIINGAAIKDKDGMITYYLLNIDC